jgi:hypothetical protein
MDAIQIVLSVIVALFGLLLSISAPKESNKRWLRITAMVLCLGFLVSQIVILNRDSREKQAREQEYLRLKYSQVLDDNKILQNVQSFRIAKNNQQSMSIDLSPTSSTMGERVKVLGIIVPCPKTLSKYYIGLMAVPEEKFSPTDKLIVVTKHTNGLIEVESVDIGTHTIDLKTFRFNAIDE